MLFAFSANAQKAKSKPAIHALNNVSHSYTFHADWGFPKQYLNDAPDKYTKSWTCIYNSDLTNANLMFLFGCDQRAPYVERDFATIQEFLKTGGGVMVLDNGGKDGEQNRLAKLYGAQFVPGFTAPLITTDSYGRAVESKKNGTCHLKLDNPKQWKVLVKDAGNNPVLASKRVGKGTMLLGSRALLADNPDKANDTINRQMWHKVWNTVASGKRVDSDKKFEDEYIDKLENTIKKDGFDISYNDYLAPCADAMFEISKRSMPFIEKRMGVPLSKNMGSKIVLIPTDGGGYSAREIIALAVWWGGFPAKEDSMIEFITHESVHSWVLPFAEIWNEPIATYVGNLVMIDMGHQAEGERRIQSVIKRAKESDPNFDLYDMEGRSCKDGVKTLDAEKVRALHWGKAFWIFEQLRKENPNFIADYFKAKRSHVDPSKIKEYKDDNTVAVMSIAMGRDMFPWMRSIGFNVYREKADVKF